MFVALRRRRAGGRGGRRWSELAAAKEGAAKFGAGLADAHAAALARASQAERNYQEAIAGSALQTQALAEASQRADRSEAALSRS